MPFSTITTEGGLLPADILDAIAAGELEGQRPEDFGLERTSNLSDRISAAWQAVRGQWALFQTYLADLPAGESATTETREQWVIPLLRILGYRLIRNRSAYLIQGRTFAISHRVGNSGNDDGNEHDRDDDGLPLHIESIRNSLDARPPSGRPRLSPHALVQEYLNSTEQLWGIVTNGERLRLLRDSSRFTRPAYVEFDLRSMLEGEKFSEFALFYRLLHRSRLPGHTHARTNEAAQCLLERYHQYALDAGGRVREGLRNGVETALKRLGDGLLRHPANAELRAKLARGLESGKDGDGSLTPLGYYRQLLRLVYRLLFLMVAEERGLIATTNEEDEGDEGDMLSPSAYLPAPDRRLAIYREHYSVSRLRRLAETSGAGRGSYTDLWLGLLTSFRLFEGSDEIAPRRLGLAPLDGDLFGEAACAALTTNTRLANADLLAAIRALSLYREQESKALRRVNYGALDVEELGSVYESLLDYRPVIRAEGGRLMADVSGTSALSPQPSALNPQPSAFDLVPGTERKTTGSYYTRPELVNELIKSALVPVLEERLKAAGPDPKAREAAILALRVCDPACGSGAFLLAAARRLGRELARVRAGEDQPSPTQFRRAVRDVIRRCIFGVDLNPLAVDLCKLSLWIEGHAAGLPLSFLDHHIRCGNSLVGATRALVEQGIPDDAYKPVTGDDKAMASSIRKRNKQERELYQRHGMVQHDLFGAAAGNHSLLADALRALDEANDDSVAAVRARAARYAALRRSAAPERAKFDLWTAAFFQPLTPENARYVPTSKDLIDFAPTGEKALMAAPLAEDVGFFHWELEFPQVFGSPPPSTLRPPPSTLRPPPSALNPPPSGGFDVVLGNPPWERIKLQEQEHFVDVPEIAGAANKAAREHKINAWRVHGTAAQKARIARFDAAKYRAEAESRFVRAAGRFPLTAVGDVNTYALFAEHARSLLAPSGRAGIIVPTGIATDDSTKAFFGDLVAGRQLLSLYDFENREKIFAEVDSRYKFSLLTMGRTTAPTRFLFFATRVAHLADERRAFTLTPEEIALINPNTRTAPVFRTAQDAELTKKIYRRAPVLINEAPTPALRATPLPHAGAGPGVRAANPWGVSFLRMFDMSNDSGLFQSAPHPGLLPLYEGRMGFIYDHRFGTFDPGVGDYVANENRDINATCVTQYFVPADEVARRVAARGWERKWFFGIRRVTRNTDVRTIIGTFVPYQAVTYGLYLFFSDVPVQQYICLAATFNSLVLDYLCRNAISQPSLTFGVLKQLPVLPPSAFTPEDIAYIVPRVVELVYTAWDIRAFAEEVWAESDSALRAHMVDAWRANMTAAGLPGETLAAPPADDTPAVARHLAEVPSTLRSPFAVSPFIWHEERRALIRAELDARIARLYGLTRDELRYILDPADIYGPEFPGETFRVLKEKEQRMYGEYRTRRLVLAAWDRENG